MSKEEALCLIDEHKNKLINPIDMLNWTYLRVIILQIPDNHWEGYLDSALSVLAQ
jgi:hypothetical protein